MAFLNKQGLSTFHTLMKAWVNAKLTAKVDKVEGKDLSTNDFTDDYLTKLNSATNVSYDRALDTGTKIGSITIDGTTTDLYAPTANGSISYENASTTKDGLMSAEDKIKLDSIVPDNMTNVFIQIPAAKLMGDVNKDGLVNRADAALINKYSAGVLTDESAFDTTVADVTDDGIINSLDADLVLQFDTHNYDVFTPEDTLGNWIFDKDTESWCCDLSVPGIDTSCSIILHMPNSFKIDAAEITITDHIRIKTVDALPIEPISCVVSYQYTGEGTVAIVGCANNYTNEQTEVNTGSDIITAIDFTNFENGSFTETVNGEVITHTVTFDDDGRPAIVDGITITWGDM